MEQEKNNSPWLTQLQRKRASHELPHDAKADVAIVGGGIAGIATAYFVLRDTSRHVLLLEADKVAHGATGHNAGQVVSYFEKPFHKIVEEFGLHMASEGAAAIESAWDLLRRIYSEAKIKTPLTRFAGYAGCTSFRQVIPHIKNNALRIEAGLAPHPIFVAEEAARKDKVPEEYRGCFKLLPVIKIRELLETDDPSFIAALGSVKGCLNSAAFTEELAQYMAENFAHRFTLVEHAPVHTLTLYKDRAALSTPQTVITAKKVVLCTNGFEYVHIKNMEGLDIDKKFHHMIRGSIGYMVAYLDPANKPPSATSYFPVETSEEERETFSTNPYFYLTRRLYYTTDGRNPNLVCIGGPEQLIEDTSAYSKRHIFPSKAKEDINAFLRKSYKHTPQGDIPHTFFWHGLMGYTPNGIRRVGFEPRNPVLLYNLGCNGIGILPSIYGGQRIAQLLRGDKLAPSIFDVPKGE